jgi:hypothetical protein
VSDELGQVKLQLVSPGTSLSAPTGTRLKAEGGQRWQLPIHRLPPASLAIAIGLFSSLFLCLLPRSQCCLRLLQEHADEAVPLCSEEFYSPILAPDAEFSFPTDPALRPGESCKAFSWKSVRFAFGVPTDSWMSLSGESSQVQE